LVDFVLEDDDAGVRREAYKGLHRYVLTCKVFHPQAGCNHCLISAVKLQPGNLVATSLEKKFSMALRDPSSQQRAVEYLRCDSLSTSFVCEFPFLVLTSWKHADAASVPFTPLLRRLVGPLLNLAFRETSDTAKDPTRAFLRSLVSNQPIHQNQEDNEVQPSRKYGDVGRTILTELGRLLPCLGDDDRPAVLELIGSGTLDLLLSLPAS
jgi:hypothetical protein